MTTPAEKYAVDMADYSNQEYKYIYTSGIYIFDICLKKGGLTKTWNGYVTLPVECPIPDNPDKIKVHGGITYSEKKDGKYVLGFDTAHGGDYSPLNIFPETLFGKPEYRTHNYVLKECEKLCDQLAS